MSRTATSCRSWRRHRDALRLLHDGEVLEVPMAVLRDLRALRAELRRLAGLRVPLPALRDLAHAGTTTFMETSR